MNRLIFSLAILFIAPYCVMAHDNQGSHVIDLDTNYYYNSKFNFEVSFPETWEVELDTVVYGLMAFAPGEGFRLIKPNITIVVERYANATLDTCGERCFYNSSLEPFLGLCKDNVRISDLNIDGKPAKLFEVECMENPTQMAFKLYTVFYNGRGYEFHVKGLYDRLEKAKSEIEFILNSFHFIEKDER